MDAPSHPIRAAAAQASLGDGARVRPQVVIVGAGFGGLEAAKALRHAPVDVIVIDRVNHHCFQPLLYQVATAALSPADIAWPIRSILSRQANARVVMAEVTAVDTARKEVRTDRTPPFRYDFLVLATGATHSYFGHDDWAPYAPGLKRIEDATEIRRRLLRAFEAAELSQDEAERRRLMNFIVVGGGPTGVELAGACAEVARHVLSRDFRRIDPRTSRIILVEAGPRILPSFPEDLARYADRTLERMGVEVVTSTAVAQCDDMGVGTADGRRFDGATIV
jgi:NADH dehydrogenase